MRSKAVWALVALNACLLACLIGQWLRPNLANAQAAAGGAARVSDYILIPGSVQSSQAQVVYMIDTTNGLLSARTFTGQQMVDMPAIDLNRLFNPKNAAGTTNNRRGNR
jgi:hypothetical protein